MSDIDAALKDFRKKSLWDGNATTTALHMHDETADTIIEALTTLRDLKQELKENGDMPNTIWLQFDNDYPKHEQEITWCEDRHHSYDKQYTRTTPTLKKILGVDL